MCVDYKETLFKFVAFMGAVKVHIGLVIHCQSSISDFEQGRRKVCFNKMQHIIIVAKSNMTFSFLSL